jgi:LTXXQ motif family protein
MQVSLSRSLRPVLIAASLFTTAVFAQAPAQSPQSEPDRASRLSPEVLARLQDGRIAMAKAALKLNDAQLKLWEPVEQQLRARFDAQRQRMAKREQQQQEQRGAAPSLPDRLDRASQRMTQRAERLKAFNAVFRPFYESLSDEQKAVARVVLRRGNPAFAHGWAHHWAMRQNPAIEQRQ